MAEAQRGGIGAAIAAAEAKSRRSLLRNHGGGHAPVSFLELFFDLVFVFAITQLSHFLKDHLTWLGFAQALVLFLAVWWAWMYTTWATNWADPERFEIRVMLLGLMALSLLMAVALPYGFSKYAWLFAASYVLLQLGRTVFMSFVLYREQQTNARNMMRIAVWFCFAAPFWLIGVLRPEEERLAWWLLAVVIEYLGPITLFPVPGLGRSKASDWDIAFALAFLSSVLMWWLYFDLGQKRGSEHISENAEVGRVARNAYTYLHMPIVLGIVIFAVADAKLLDNWSKPADGKLALVMCGGGVLFLVGLGLFKRNSNPLGNFPLSHLIGTLLFVGLGYAAWQGLLTTLQVGGLGVAAFAVVSGWEWVSYHGGWKERIDDTIAWFRLARQY
ncbi:MAG: low temperature requirement protein A [Novosphingobium sp.]|nr:low temperature requirement protein A [Novosphingobium sp.]